MQATFSDTARVLEAGEPAIFPTDTIYGLGVSVRDASGPEALYALKQREAGKPIAWLVGNADDAAAYAAEPPSYLPALLEAFWPGALTVVVRAGEAVPTSFAPDGTVGLRMPAGETALALIAELGCPLATTSVNISGEEPATRFSQIGEEFDSVPALEGDGDIVGALASTVIDCTGAEPRILREGAITADMIRQAIGGLESTSV